ncbi:hypothetical protein K439DRAFT_1665124 [Ramaria rubella]|nr:hypothetical protein K439DRAFT_1665124 [Ramaria rubella]
MSMQEMQLAIRSLWALILCIQEAPLCIDDDFYTVGGDSISAIQLASAAHKAGLHLPGTNIICHPTICAMAQIAESAAVDHKFDDDKALSITLDEMAPEDLTVLAMDQAHLNFLTTVRLFPDHGPSARAADQPAHGMDLPLRTHRDRLQEVFEEFIDHPNSMMFGTVFAFDPMSNR